MSTKEKLNARLTPFLSQLSPNRILVNTESLDWGQISSSGRPDFFTVPHWYSKKREETGEIYIKDLLEQLQKQGAVFNFGTPFPELLDQVQIFQPVYETRHIVQLFHDLSCLPDGEHQGMLYDRNRFLLLRVAGLCQAKVSARWVGGNWDMMGSVDEIFKSFAESKSRGYDAILKLLFVTKD